MSPAGSLTCISVVGMWGGHGDKVLWGCQGIQRPYCVQHQGSTVDSSVSVAYLASVLQLRHDRDHRSSKHLKPSAAALTRCPLWVFSLARTVPSPASAALPMRTTEPLKEAKTVKPRCCASGLALPILTPNLPCKCSTTLATVMKMRAPS